MEYIIKEVRNSLNLSNEIGVKVSFLGGMTNKNYLISTEGRGDLFVFRLPGVMTENFIKRENESVNSLIMSEKGFNVETCFFDAKTGIKITKFLENSEALNHQSIKKLSNLKKIAKRLKELHSISVEFNGEFNIFIEFDKYISLLKNKDLFYKFSEDMPQLIDFFTLVKSYLIANRGDLIACHNDIVPENVLIKNEEVYFIDWEYSGMNDPMFDIAALFVESRLNKDEQEYFLKYYFEEQESINIDNKLKRTELYKFTQDVLWFAWTLVKEENDEFFGDYGQKRIERAVNFMKSWNHKEI